MNAPGSRQPGLIPCNAPAGLSCPGLVSACAKLAAVMLLGLAIPGWAQPAPTTPAPGPRTAFRSAGTNGFEFDTGTLRGKLRAGGVSKGLTEVVHIPSGQRLDASMGLLSHYRLLTAGKRYGNGAWDLPSNATLLPDGSVLVSWPGAPDRPFDLHAHYRISAPDTIDVETSILSRTNLAGFESFLACYFDRSFSNAFVSAGGKWVRATQDKGEWLAFPRDEQAAQLIRDGRWTLPPNPVDWVLQPGLDRPLAYRVAPRAGITAVLMSRGPDCFAVMTPFETEPHYSMYLSLLGRALEPGAAASAQARLVVRAGLDETGVASLWGEWGKGRKTVAPPGPGAPKR
jgi:hypothetical protein